MLSSRVWIGLTSLVALTGCDLCACSPPRPQYESHISGFVRETTGKPVGATVRSEANRGGCGFADPGPAAVEPAAGATDATGKYDLLVVSPNPGVVCLRVVAHRAGLADSAVRDSIRFLPGVSEVLDFTFP